MPKRVDALTKREQEVERISKIKRLKLECSPKERRFVKHYLAQRSESAAAALAGYRLPNAAGQRLIHEPRIKKLIDLSIAKRVAGRQETLGELSEIATAPWRDFIDVVTDPKTGEVIRSQIKLADKIKAIELLGKHLRLFDDHMKIRLDGLIAHEMKLLQSARKGKPLQETTTIEAIDAEVLALPGAASATTSPANNFVPAPSQEAIAAPVPPVPRRNPPKKEGA